MNKEDRLKGIGGSDVASILGISRFKTSVELWYEKSNKIINNGTETDIMALGSFLEPFILKKYEKITGNKVYKIEEQLSHPEYDWLIANLDGMTEENGEKIVFEAKISLHKGVGSGWGDEDKGIVPLEYMCQCQHYMHVTGAKMAHLAVMFLNSVELKIYKIKYSQEIIDEIMPTLDKFWNFNVKKNAPPDPEDFKDVKIIYNKPVDEEIIITDEIMTKVHELNQIKMNKKMVSIQEDKYKKIIAGYMGNKTKLVNEVGEKIATFSPRKDGARVFKLS